MARDEADFRSLLSEMGVAVADNSPRAQRRDWVYSLADAPTRRISGESLGLSYGRDRLLARFSSGASALATDGGRSVAAAAAEAVRVGSVDELRGLAEAVSFVGSRRIRSIEELRRAADASPAMGEKCSSSGSGSHSLISTSTTVHSSPRLSDLEMIAASI